MASISITDIQQGKTVDVDFISGDMLVNITFTKTDIKILSKIIEILKET